MYTMTKGGRHHIKTRLRTLQAAVSVQNTPSLATLNTLAPESVSAQLARLRIEQARAEWNKTHRGRNGVTSSSVVVTEIPQAILQNDNKVAIFTRSTPFNCIQELLATDPSEYGSAIPGSEHGSTIPGPPPPRSWKMGPSENLTKRRRRPSTSSLSTQAWEQSPQEGQEASGRAGVMRSGMPTLVSFCAAVVARHLESFYLPRQRSILYSFANLPGRLKQHILYEATWLRQSSVSEQTINMFLGSEYEELDLENARISYEQLVKGWWRVKREKVRKVVESWEELEEEEKSEESGSGESENGDWDTCDEGKEVYKLEANSPSKKHDSSDENTNRISGINGTNGHTRSNIESPRIRKDILQLLRPDLVSLKAPLRNYKIITPLASTLRALNLSFVPNLPALHLCCLITITLPRLTSLSVAGCFNAYDGPYALSILSRGLQFLEEWDVGHHPWLRLQNICGSAIRSAINWDRDLQALRVLRVELGGNIAIEIVNWFLAREMSGLKSKTIQVVG